MASLRVEVHRAREFLSGYNSVLEACKRESTWLRLVLVLWCIYIGRGRRKGSIESAIDSICRCEKRACQAIRSGTIDQWQSVIPQWLV